MKYKQVQYHNILWEGNKFEIYLDNYEIAKGNFTITSESPRL